MASAITSFTTRADGWTKKTGEPFFTKLMAMTNCNKAFKSFFFHQDLQLVQQLGYSEARYDLMDEMFLNLVQRSKFMEYSIWVDELEEIIRKLCRDLEIVHQRKVEFGPMAKSCVQMKTASKINEITLHNLFDQEQDLVYHKLQTKTWERDLDLAKRFYDSYYELLDLIHGYLTEFIKKAQLAKLNSEITV